VKVLLKAHWLLVVVKTSKDWTWPIVKLFIVVYYVSHFYSGANIYNVNQYNNLIAFIVTSSNGTESMYIQSLAFGNYVVSEFTVALENLMVSL